MKDFLLLVSISLVLVGCERLETESAAARTRIDAPYYPEIEFYLLEGPGVGAIGVMDLELWKNGQTGTNFSIGDLDEATGRTINLYAMTSEYKGSARSERIDFHSLTISAPGAEPVIMEVGFDGTPKEVWKDSRYAAGIRPRAVKETNETLETAPGHF